MCTLCEGEYVRSKIPDSSENDSSESFKILNMQIKDRKAFCTEKFPEKFCSENFSNLEFGNFLNIQNFRQDSHRFFIGLKCNKIAIKLLCIREIRSTSNRQSSF